MRRWMLLPRPQPSRCSPMVVLEKLTHQVGGRFLRNSPLEQATYSTREHSGLADKKAASWFCKMRVPRGQKCHMLDSAHMCTSQEQYGASVSPGISLHPLMAAALPTCTLMCRSTQNKGTLCPWAQALEPECTARWCNKVSSGQEFVNDLTAGGPCVNSNAALTKIKVCRDRRKC